MNIPENRWGVWDHAAEEWRETMLGTTEEADARQSAEVLNAMPDGFTFGVRLRIRRPPRTFLARMVVTVAFASAGMQLSVPGNWHPAGPAVGFMIAMLGLGWSWWKLFQIERYSPDVHMQLEMNPTGDEEASG